jgi:hypothetical protein
LFNNKGQFFSFQLGERIRGYSGADLPLGRVVFNGCANCCN